MLNCALTRGPCSAKPAPDPLPCPMKPKKPFPWIYLYCLGAFVAFMGLLYKFYLWREDYQKYNDTKAIWRPRPKMKRPYHDKDLPACVQYLIIGAGAAGWAAYRAIMENDKTAKVFFVSKEDILPYRRPPMSKYMWYNSEPPDVKTLHYVEKMQKLSMYQAPCKTFMDPVAFYRKKKGPAVSVATGWCVLRVDADDHVAWIKTLKGETPIYYERCLIAVGSQPKTLEVFKTAPKNVRSRVTTFRTVRDLEIAYRKVREAKDITIIGGGLLGSELAWHLGRMHKEWQHLEGAYEPVHVNHVIKDPGILASIIPEYLSVWALERIKCENVTTIPRAQVYDAFESEDGRLQLTLSNGESIVTDYVFVCVGTVPREDIAEDSFLELDPKNGGFVVNTELEARKHLYVAGDAASIYSQWKGTRLRMEHYTNAEEQGLIAGANMTGYWTPANMEPHFYFQLGDDLDMEVVGEVGACMPTIGIFKPCKEDADAIKYQTKRGDLDKPCYKQSVEYKNLYKRGMLFYLRNETVVGIVFWNFPAIEDRKEVATELLRAQPSYKDINMLAQLLGYSELECTVLPPEEREAEKVCIKHRVF